MSYEDGANTPPMDDGFDDGGGAYDDNAQAIDICPSGLKDRRACMVCSLIKTFDQFENDRCENCTGVRGWEADTHTSANFQGAVAVIEPRESWCARWQRIEHYKPGVYALCVYGTVDAEYREEMGEFRSRDTSKDLGT
eukprot:gene13891-17417_t